MNKTVASSNLTSGHFQSCKWRWNGITVLFLHFVFWRQSLCFVLHELIRGGRTWRERHLKQYLQLCMNNNSNIYCINCSQILSKVSTMGKKGKRSKKEDAKKAADKSKYFLSTSNRALIQYWTQSNVFFFSYRCEWNSNARNIQGLQWPSHLEMCQKDERGHSFIRIKARVRDVYQARVITFTLFPYDIGVSKTEFQCCFRLLQLHHVNI